MDWIIGGVSRWIWGWMLWFMRRPFIKELQRKSTRMFGPRFEQKAYAHLVAQNRFARRYGLGMLRVSVLLLFGSMMVTATFFFALYMIDQGWLSVPQTSR